MATKKTNPMTRRITLGPFNRVEGDLEVTLDVTDGIVRAAYVNSPLYRGFEQILQGRHPEDALALVPRICGICSVAQSAAAAQALAKAMNLVPPPNGKLAADITLAAENLADHLTHFYLFFMPDFARAAYGKRDWFAATEARFKAQVGSAADEVLTARASFMRAMGLLAGKWPHTLSLQPGGSSKPLQSSEKIRLYRVLREFRAFCERTLFADALEAVANIDSANALDAWLDKHRDRSDFARFLAIADDLQLEQMGRATDLFISYGAFGIDAGVWRNDSATLAALDTDAIREDLSHAWYAEAEAPQAPSLASTLPLAEKDAAYSWCKAPRLDGEVAECGALARQLVAGHPLLRDLAARNGGNVKSRVVARLIEIARVLPLMEQWADSLQPGEPYCAFGELPDEADTVGLIEAARGSLGHWLSIRRGRIHNYQIIAPTTWNFSPRDGGGTPGALEQALAGTVVQEGENALPSVQHIVRSFDPCMVCTVH